MNKDNFDFTEELLNKEDDNKNSEKVIKWDI